MAQPANWLWGLVPLALLWSVGNFLLDDTVQRDVSRRAIAAATPIAGAAPGARPVMVRVAGRDVTVAGEALSSDGATKAMVQLRNEFGLRRALGGLSQVMVQKPYSWAAAREGQVVTLSGFVPDEATAKANVAAAGAALPGLRIEDRQFLAFGAPAGFAEMTLRILPRLSSLASGKVALDDTRFCIEGKASSPEGFLALRAGSAGLGQGAFSAVDCPLEPPIISPYRWSAQKSAEGRVSVSGFYPSDEVRQKIAQALRRGFPEPAVIDDRSMPGHGEPSAYLAQVERAAEDLARLRSGEVSVEAGTYRISGDGPSGFEACQALRLLIAQMDGPDSVAQATIACPPPPAPPPLPPLPDIAPLQAPPPDGRLQGGTLAPAPSGSAAVASTISATGAQSQQTAVPLSWSAERRAGVLVLKGIVPDEAARQAVLRAARGAMASGQLEDRMTLEPNLKDAPDLATATGFLLEQLGRMSHGSVAIDGTRATLSGVVVDAQGWQAIAAALQHQPLPGGLTGAPDLAGLVVRPYALTVRMDGSGLGLSGYLPDGETRSAILALLGETAGKGKIEDTTQIVPGAPAGFGQAVRIAVTDLLRLDLGSARLVDSAVELQGLTCRELIKSEVETSAGSGLPPGFSGKAEISMRQTGCVLDPPNTCQNDLDALTGRHSVLFGQGTAVVTLDPTTERAMAEASAILKQCPYARVTIEGHANFDGERRGFDNLELSSRRARRVLEELVDRGIDKARLDARGFGVQRPLVPHDEPEAKVMNRRVQFTVAK